MSEMTDKRAREILAGVLRSKDLMASEWNMSPAFDGYAIAQGDALRAIESALSDPQPPAEAQPVAYASQESIDVLAKCHNDGVDGYADVWVHPDDPYTIPLYTAPPSVPDLDYETRADGERVRKDRWETGFRNIVSILVGPRAQFEIADIVERVRSLSETSAPIGVEHVNALRELLDTGDVSDWRAMEDALRAALAQQPAAPDISSGRCDDSSGHKQPATADPVWMGIDWAEGQQPAAKPFIGVVCPECNAEYVASAQQPAAVDGAWQVQLADALECFWNPAIGAIQDASYHGPASGSDVVGAIAQGLAAVAVALRGSTQQGDRSDD